MPVSLSARVIDWLSQWISERTDGVVAVASSRENLPLLLSSVNASKSAFGALGFVDSLSPLAVAFARFPDAESGQDLDAGVACVDLQRHIGMMMETPVQVVDSVVKLNEQLSEFNTDLRM